ncbi:MAG: Crp/Fnr family transcriptional regulator [Bacteroidia bacterium]
MIIDEKIHNSLNRFHFYSGIRFDTLPENEQSIIFENSKLVSLEKKKVLFRQGSFPNGIYMLKKGMVKVYQLNYDGSVQILFIYSPCEVFGYRPILSNEYHPVTVAALDSCELLFIDRNRFLEVLQKSVALSNQLLFSLSHEFTVMTNRINVFAQRGIKERLALALLILNEKFKNENNGTEIAEIKLPRTDLANFVGTSLENLVRTLSFFKEKRLIRVKGKSIFIEHFENLYILSAID